MWITDVFFRYFRTTMEPFGTEEQDTSGLGWKGNTCSLDQCINLLIFMREWVEETDISWWTAKTFEGQQRAVLPSLWSARPSSALEVKETQTQKGNIQPNYFSPCSFTCFCVKAWVVVIFDSEVKHCDRTQPLVALNPDGRRRDEAVRRLRRGCFRCFCQVLVALVLHRFLRVLIVLIFIHLLCRGEGGKQKWSTRQHEKREKITFMIKDEKCKIILIEIKSLHPIGSESRLTLRLHLL